MQGCMRIWVITEYAGSAAVLPTQGWAHQKLTVPRQSALIGSQKACRALP